jgi:hypothetical protein
LAKMLEHAFRCVKVLSRFAQTACSTSCQFPRKAGGWARRGGAAGQ